MLQKESNNNSPVPLGKALPWVSLRALLPSRAGWVGLLQHWVLTGDPTEVLFLFTLLLLQL